MAYRNLILGPNVTLAAHHQSIPASVERRTAKRFGTE